MYRSNTITKGFTLVEMAVVLTIIAIVIGGLVQPLSIRLAEQKNQDTQLLLQQSYEALLGYALINHGLPCPDTDSSVNSNTSGMENRAATPSVCSNVEGFLPWKTLSLKKGHDAWGNRIRYRADNVYTDATATILSAFIVTRSGMFVENIQATKITPLDTAPSPDQSRVAAIIYSCGENGLPDLENKPSSTSTCTDVATIPNADYTHDGQGSTFDDLLIWLPRNVLINQLVNARVL